VNLSPFFGGGMLEVAQPAVREIGGMSEIVPDTII
jgi:hypothetical protein